MSGFIKRLNNTKPSVIIQSGRFICGLFMPSHSELLFDNGVSHREFFVPVPIYSIGNNSLAWLNSEQNIIPMKYVYASLCDHAWQKCETPRANYIITEYCKEKNWKSLSLEIMTARCSDYFSLHPIIYLYSGKWCHLTETTFILCQCYFARFR